MTHDRADAATRAILQMVVRHIRDADGSLHTVVAEYLRDEFAEIARETLTDVRLGHNDEPPTSLPA